MQPNTNFQLLRANYLFTEIFNRGKAYQEVHPESKLIKLGIGDVTRPLPKAITEAMHKAVEELAHEDTFRGYGLEQGSEFLRETIIAHDYCARGISLDIDEVFISDGAGSDLGNIGDILARENRIAVQDPVYPVYVDTNVMAGRAGEWRDGGWSDIVYLPQSAENGFVPALPSVRPDVIYLCFPNNPTGTTLTKSQLRQWVDYARENRCLIIFDSAYEVFIEEADVPHSIYEIEGAKEVAVEIRSFSKTAGFTSVRCGYTVVPKATGLNELWYRRQCTKYNGTSYISQRGAEATYSPEGHKGVMENIAYYKRNARLISACMREAGYGVYGGVNSPYIWIRTPHGLSSWDFFDCLLNRCQVLCTPGSGFGKSGEGYVRLSSFGRYEDTIEAMERIKTLL